MNALTVHEHDAVILAAALAAIASIASAYISGRTRRDQRTNNGHTIGEAVRRIEDRMQDHETRLDRIEVRLVEDVDEIKQRLASAVFDQERHMVTYRHERRLVDE